jgi:hypothetical protein
VYHEITQSWPQVLPRLLQMLNSDPASKRPMGVSDSTRVKIALCFSALLGHSTTLLFPSRLSIRGKFSPSSYRVRAVDCQLDLVELEVVGHFIDLLASPNQRLQFYAITALRNLSTYYGTTFGDKHMHAMRRSSHKPYLMSWARVASVRREIQHVGGLAELLMLVHGPGRAAVSVARLEAMRTIANLSVTGMPLYA